jgi:CubicO group peptidase (beta-lactamase class C family)
MAELPNNTRDHPAREMTTDALFATCSTTKAFTSAATSIAIQDSQSTESPIHWSTPLASLMPEDFVLDDGYATKNITLEDALSHRTGMPEHNWTLALFSKKDHTPGSMVRAMRHMPLATPLRTKYHYSNHMYIAVSHALEQHTGGSLGTFMKKRIWEPLDMTETYFGIAEARKDPSSKAKLVPGYDWYPGKEGGSFIPRPYQDWPANSGAGTIISNVLDYARWVRELIEREGPLKGHETVIDPRTISFENDDLSFPAPFHLYALGWMVDSYRGQYLYSHGGGWPGYASWVAFVPSKSFGCVVMGNSSSARYAAFKLVTYLLDKHLDLPVDPAYQEQIAACSPRHAREWHERLENENPNISKQRLFPQLSDPPLPHSLPLSKYAGIYKHPTQTKLTLIIDSESLTADLRDRIIPCELCLDHISGEYFVGRFHSEGHNLTPPFLVEFHLDCAGVTKIGLDLEPEMKGEKIWFERCES